MEVELYTDIIVYGIGINCQTTLSHTRFNADIKTTTRMFIARAATSHEFTTGKRQGLDGDALTRGYTMTLFEGKQ